MKKQSYILTSISAALLAIALGGAFIYNKTQNEKRVLQEQDQARKSLLLRSDNHSLGPVSAKVTLVEFFDPECETCRAIYPGIKDLIKYYEGQVRLVVRYMPFHPNSHKAATALEAAAEQGRFWELLTVMFERQPEWADHHTPKPELVTLYAKELGLNMEKFKVSSAKPEHRNRIESDQADGRTLGVTGTPTFFVNGRILLQLGFGPLKQLIDEELAKKQE
jgi:protein-disulfide isomerase